MKSPLSYRYRSGLAASMVVAGVLAAHGHASAQERLFFASDVHASTDPSSSWKGVLAGALSGACGFYPCEVVGFVGDYGVSYPTTWDEFNLVQPAISEAVPGVTQVLSQGNHDTLEKDGNVQYTTRNSGWVSLSGNQDYDIYAINASDFGNWASRLDADLGAYQGGKVVFIMSHRPLHTTRDSELDSAKRAIFEILQSRGKQMDIVFLWGHNHHRGFQKWDEGVDMMAIRGERVGTGPYILSDVGNAELSFNYLNAGYLIMPPQVDGTWYYFSSWTVVTVDANSIVFDRDMWRADDAVLPRVKPRQ